MRIATLIGRLAGALMASCVTVSAQAGTGWLDRPMTSWNQPSAGVPASGITADSGAALARRCGFSVPLKPDTTSTPASTSTDAVRRAGWVPFLHLDQAIARDDVEVIGGMTAASPGCEPILFNLFAFAGGRFAGTVSPTPMTPSRDGAAGAVRITGTNALTVEFARYAAGDSECCPSSRVRVTYRIDKTGAGPTLIATDARQLR